MRSVKPAMASETMLDLARYHLAALARSEGTQAFASAFQPAQNDLRTATTARVEAEQAMTDLRVAVSFSEKALERAIRQVALLAHGADNNATGGPAFKALFPNGLDTELRPIGASQVAAAVALRERLNTQPAAAKVGAFLGGLIFHALHLGTPFRGDGLAVRSPATLAP